MSIQAEINRITGAKTAIASAIEGKGVSVPSGTSIDGLAPLIASIPAGGNLDEKMDAVNPVGSGSFSLNRRGGSTVGDRSHVFGDDCAAGGYAAHAGGLSSEADGDCAHAMGDTVIASGYASHAECSFTAAEGDYSHAEGDGTTASGTGAHAEGVNTLASGDYSHAEGGNINSSGGTMKNKTFNVDGISVTVAGSSSQGTHAHAEGVQTLAYGYASHAEGSTTLASGSRAHAEGTNNTASGTSSHAEGQGNVASGLRSHAEGFNTKASSDDQHVQGKYNVEDTGAVYVHIVGNGTANSNRSNAHTLDWDGNAWYAGDVECTGIILTSPNGTKFRITVADNGTLSASAVS